MGEIRVLEMELLGRALFDVAVKSVEGASAAKTEHEKEGFVVEIFAYAEQIKALQERIVTEDDHMAVTRGMNLACEEWVRPTAEPTLPNV